MPFGAQHADALTNLETRVPSRLLKNRRLTEELQNGWGDRHSSGDNSREARAGKLPFDGKKAEPNQLHSATMTGSSTRK